jgi:hypothetical protein
MANELDDLQKTIETLDRITAVARRTREELQDYAYDHNGQIPEGFDIEAELLALVPLRTPLTKGVWALADAVTTQLNSAIQSE